MSETPINEYVNKNAINVLLGTLLQHPKLLREYPLSNEDFPELFHRLIYAAINNLVRNGADELDTITIDEYLSHYEVQYEVFNRYNGLQYLETIKQLGKSGNIEHVYSQVRKFSLLRRYKAAGIDVSEYYDPDNLDPEKQEQTRAKLDSESVTDIINHFKRKQIMITAPFLRSESRDSKRAGTGGEEQLDSWKESTAWGLGYSSAYLTNILHGMRPRTFTVRSAGTGVGKTRMALADMAHACVPYYWDSHKKCWSANPNGTSNGAVYVGTEMELASEIDPILWAYIADVPEDHIKYNDFEPGEEERVRQAIQILDNEANIWLEYLPDFTVGALSDVIEEHVLNHNIQHVFFDYIHSTPELLSEFAAQSASHMGLREDQGLLYLSTKLKQMSRDFGVSINSATQVNGDFRNDEIRDQTVVAGAKSILNKADNGMILSRPTERELKQVSSIIKSNVMPTPNLVCSVYKVRGGKFTNVKVWMYVDYSTMRTHDLFVTDYNYNLLTNIAKIYINVNESEVASQTPSYLGMDELPESTSEVAF